jgi:tripartite-type tricarboxylate transporter receptor subunit TctC
MKPSILAIAAMLVDRGADASAQTWPAKPIRWIVGFPPGGGADVLSRMLGEISERGWQIIIDAPRWRGGLSAPRLRRSRRPTAPDIGAYSGTHSVNRSIYSQMPFQESDFAPIMDRRGAADPRRILAAGERQGTHCAREIEARPA